MEFGEIMSAKHILIIASGKAKAPIIKELIEGPVTPKVPASILKLHNNVTLIADAVKMASTNCARALQLNDTGVIEVGKKADIIIFDEGINIKRVLIEGKELFKKHHLLIKC